MPAASRSAQNWQRRLQITPGSPQALSGFCLVPGAGCAVLVQPPHPNHIPPLPAAPCPSQWVPVVGPRRGAALPRIAAPWKSSIMNKHHE